MGKRGSVWFDDQGYIERIKSRADLPDLNNLGPTHKRRWCEYNPQTRTLTLESNNGQIVALTFRNKEDEKTSGQALLFEVGYDLWNSGTVEFTLQEVLKRCSDKFKRSHHITDATNVWFKNTRVNLRRTIEQSPVKDFVVAFHTSHPRSGKYQFFIKPITV